MKKTGYLLLFFLSVCFSLKAKIYDAFPFFNELELLSIRLEELDSVVDYFVIVEATKTFSGDPKPLYFNENRHLFKPYLHKIIHIIVDDYPLIDEKLPLTAQPWIREEHQRNAILRGLVSATKSDMIMITDVDEIPRKEAVLSAQKWLSALSRRTKIVAFDMPLYRYQLNRVALAHWTLGFATTMKTFLKFSPEAQIHKLRILGKYDHIIPNAGWHFSSQGGLNRVLEKLKSYSHSHDPDILLQRKQLLEDFEKMKASCPMVPLDNTWPSRILRMKAEYDAMGWIAH